MAKHETREELLLRLTNPQLPMREVRAILRLSDDAIRRYDAYGTLPAERTEGGHRVWRLKDVMEFGERVGVTHRGALEIIGCTPEELKRLCDLAYIRTIGVAWHRRYNERDCSRIAYGGTNV